MRHNTRQEARRWSRIGSGQLLGELEQNVDVGCGLLDAAACGLIPQPGQHFLVRLSRRE